MLVRTTVAGETTLESLDKDMDGVIEQLNRQADQLDSFTHSLAVLSKGTFTVSWDGTVAGGSSANNSVSHSLGYAPIFLAYYKWSGDAAGLWRPLDDVRFDSTGTALWQLQCYTTQNVIYATLNVAQAGSSSTFTIAYFLLKEPAQTT